MKAKRVLALTAASALSISLLAGCGGSDSSGAASSSAESADASSDNAQTESGELVEVGSDVSGDIVVGGWPSGDDAFEAAMVGFNEKYPNINVELQFTDTSAHHQNLQTALAAGSGAPDVAMVEG